MRYEKLKDDIEEIDDEGNPYGALYIISNIFVIMGWSIIILGVVFVTLLFLGNTLGLTEKITKETSGPTYNLVSFALMITLWIPTTLWGVSVIASGELLKVILDIRGDVRKSRRYIRRFGFFVSRSLNDGEE